MSAGQRALAVTTAALLAAGACAGAAMSDTGAQTNAPPPGGAAHGGRGTPMRLVGHETDAGQIDIGQAGASLGDEVIFHGALRDATDSREVGHFEGILTAATPDGESLYEARIVLALPRGQIAVQGELDFTAEEPFVHAITGGTGAYQDARGEFSFRHTKTQGVIAITLELRR